MDLVDKDSLVKLNEQIMNKINHYYDVKFNDKLEIINISAKTGENFEQLGELIENNAKNLKDRITSKNKIIKLIPEDELKENSENSESYNCYC